MRLFMNEAILGIAQYCSSSARITPPTPTHQSQKAHGCESKRTGERERAGARARENVCVRARASAREARERKREREKEREGERERLR